jgi:hypothetical protein
MNFNWNALIPALVGGLIAGTSAILATWFTYGHNTRLHRQQQQRKINGLLLAMKHEIVTVADILQRKTGHLLDQLENGKPYLHYFMLTRDYFLIYPHNTELIGQIDDQDLCKAIIETYSTTNYVIEGLRVNNWYLEKLSEFRSRQGQYPNSNYISTNIQSIEKNLIEYAPGLKQGNIIIKQQMGSLVSRIDAYLKRHAEAR